MRVHPPLPSMSGVFAIVALFLIAAGVLALAVFVSGGFAPAIEAPPFRETRVRYPNEEAIAKKACADRKLMYWWIADPRKASATMTVRCTGQITKTVEVKF